MHELPQNLLEQIKQFEDIFTVDRAKLKEIVDHFVKELEKGMSRPIYSDNVEG
jgi:hexokinase